MGVVGAVWVVCLVLGNGLTRRSSFSNWYIQGLRYSRTELRCCSWSCLLFHALTILMRWAETDARSRCQESIYINR
ncbi:hypothetical protein B0T13DRAFT_42488 [Neurospora crassa]|nr:hypothetical protein B0T13DRAFT_42488 [Neurospora crassa]